MPKLKLVLALLLSSIFIVGCQGRLLEKEAAAKSTAENADRLQTQAGATVPTALSRASSTSKDAGSWIPVKPVKVAPKVELPSSLSKKISIDRDVTTISEVAERITFHTGIPVSVAPDLASMQAPGLSLPGQQPGAAGALATPPLPQQMMPGMTGQGGLTNPTAMIPRVSISYSGPVSGLLDMASARWGATWDYREGRLYLYRMQSKTFVIHAVPGDANSTAQIGAASSASTGASGSSSGSSSSSSSSGSSTGTAAATQNTSVVSALSVWTAIDEAVKSMLSQGGKASISPATGTLTVTDIPDVLSRVEEYVKAQNASLARQVFVNVQVHTVRLNDNDQYGLDWGLVFNALSGNFGWTFSNATSLVTSAAAASLNMQILDTAGAGGQDIGAWKGSKAVVKAISSQGAVSTVTTATVHTLNNQPVPLQRVQQTSYLASSATTTAANVGTTATLTPGVVTTGFAMNLLPHILDGGRVLMQFSVDLSKLERINTVTSGGSSIQTPDVSAVSFLQRVALKSGQTLILTGFENLRAGFEREGMGSPNNWFLGGGVNGDRGRDIVVMLITPVVIDRTI